MAQIDLKKYSVAEIALLAVFVVALAIAHLIAKSRSDITLSKLLEIPGIALQCSMPEGMGWQSSPSWKFVRNAYVRKASYGQDEDNAGTEVTIELEIAANKLTAEDQLQMRSVQYGGSLAASRSIPASGITVTAAQIDFRQSQQVVIVAAAAVGNARMLTIQVVDRAGSSDYAWTILQKIAGAIVFKPSPDLDAGAAVVDALRKKGLNSWLARQGNDHSYLIAADGDSESGFLVNLFGSVADSDYGIRCVDAYYLRDRGGQEGILQTDPHLGKWLWVSNVLGSAGARTGRVEAFLNTSGQVVFRKFGGFTELYRPAAGALPEPLLNAAIAQMIDANTLAATFDVIESQSRIVPTAVTIIRTAGTLEARCESLDTTGNTEKLAFDPDMRLIHASIAGNEKLELRPASRADVLKNFPLWADYLETLDQLLLEPPATPQQNPRRSGYNDSAI